MSEVNLLGDICGATVLRSIGAQYSQDFNLIEINLKHRKRMDLHVV